MNENKHYIRLDLDGYVIHAYSDAFESFIDGDICIEENGGRQLIINGIMNPPILSFAGTPIYKYENNEIIKEEKPKNVQIVFDNKSEELLLTYYTVIKTTVQYMNKTFGCNEADQEMLRKALRAIDKGLLTDPLIPWQTYLGEETLMFTPQELSGLEDAISTQDFMLWQKYLLLMNQLKAIDLNSPTAISDIQSIVW